MFCSPHEIEELFKKFENANRKLDIWQVPEVFKQLRINITEEELFNHVFDMELPNEIDTVQLKQLALRAQRSTNIDNKDQDIAVTWNFLRGCDDQEGCVTIAQLNQLSERYNLGLNFLEIAQKMYGNVSELDYKQFCRLLEQGVSYIE